MLERDVLGKAAPALGALWLALTLFTACGGKATGARGAADDPETLVRAFVASALGGDDGNARFYPPHDLVAAICEGDAAAVSAVLDAAAERVRTESAETAGLEVEVLGVTVPSGEPKRWTIAAGDVWRGAWAEGACKVRQPIEVAELTVATRATYQGETRQGENPMPVVRIGDHWYVLATTPARQRELSPLEAALDQCREMYAHAQPLMDLRDATDAEVLGLCEGTSRGTLRCILEATDEAAIEQCMEPADQELCEMAGENRYWLATDSQAESHEEAQEWIEACVGTVNVGEVLCIVSAGTYWDATRCTGLFYE